MRMKAKMLIPHAEPLMFYSIHNSTTLPIRPFPAMRKQLHTHAYHEIFLCTHAGWQITQHGVTAMRENDLFFFPAGHLHIAASSKGEVCSGMILFLSEELFSPAITGDGDTRHILQALCRIAEETEYRITLTSVGVANIRQLFRTMVEEFKERASGYKSAAKSAAQSLILTMMRESISQELLRQFQPSDKRERLSEVLCFLHAQYMHPISVAQMLEIANMGRSQFHAVFKAETGMTLAEYVMTLRLSEAEQLLCESETPIVEIACRCGFATLSYFYRAFRARYGFPPNVFRQQNRRCSLDDLALQASPFQRITE